MALTTGTKLGPYEIQSPRGAETKKMASQIPLSCDLWNLERYLTHRRKEIDCKYDFRDSRLSDVLERLLYENRLDEWDLGAATSIGT